MRWWQEIGGLQYMQFADFHAWRIVEDQSKSTTRKYVDTAKEHELLEALLEASKPKIKYYGDEKYFNGLHYLLLTPFRYPPLKWGSRFGSRFERGILYAALDLETAMCEKAFYRLVFLQASEGQLGGKTLSFTAFNLRVRSDNYIDLCAPPFNEQEEQIASKESYQFSQALGQDMRADGITCFCYKSARSIKAGVNVGVFTPKALTKNEKLAQTFEHLNAYFTKEIVEFSYKHRKAPTYVFPYQSFMVKGKLPVPPG